jgi:uroporphyrin-3 C-methyltransferase
LSAKGKEPVKLTADPDDTGFSVERILDDLWQGFKSMMVIRHHDKPIAAMLPPEQRYFLIQNLRLKLEGAKAALLGRDAAFFRDNLTAASAWVEQYFALESPEVRDFQQQLETLSDEQIAPTLPDITGSLRVLQERREQMNRGGLE